MPHRYVPLPTDPSQVGAQIERLRAGEFAGLNVTVPHKAAVVPYADAVSPAVRLLGVANTLVRGTDGCITAHNTDVDALVGEFRALVPGESTASKRAIVLGSGGAARAAILALCMFFGKGARVEIRARSFADVALAESDLAPLGDSLGATLVASPFAKGAGAHPHRADSDSAEADASIVVQATSIGMLGDLRRDAVDAVDFRALPKNAFVYDVVYPVGNTTTPFLEEARNQQISSADGLGMLARQGARAFELWLGSSPLEAMVGALQRRDE
jgi:shikimate dehydrogenase